MKVSFLMLGKKDFVSGGYIFNHRMVRRLTEEGAEVDVIHFTNVPEDIPQHPFRGGAYVCRRILKFDPDVIVISKSYAHAWLFRIIKAFLGIPVIYLMHGIQWADQRNRLRAGTYSGFVRWLLGMADAVWVNSASTMEGILETGIPRERLILIPPGFERSDTSIPDRSEREGPPRFLSVGAVSPVKGQDILIRACALMDEGSFTLELAGSMENREDHSERMVDLVSELGLGGAVTFLGNLSGEELAAAYDRADVLVHPSRREAFGMAVVEGMWHGLPVVAASVGALPELVHHAVNGLLVPPEDPEELATALRTLAEDPGLRCRMGRESRAIASELNDWDDTERDFVSLVIDTAEGGTTV